MKIICFLLILLMAGFPENVMAQTTPAWIDSKPNATVSVSGSLSEGIQMEDLSWAWNSANACFVATQQSKFTGHHVLYQTSLPPRSEMYVKVIPQNKNTNLSIYAYQGNGEYIVPNLPRCVTCEADFKRNYGPSTPGNSREVRLNAIRNSYTVTIGIAGADGLTEGDFTLEIRLVGGEEEKPVEQLKIPKYRIESQKGKTLVFTGKLEDGVIMQDLSWAWNSSNACFVATKANKFNGHHILYVTELPAYSEMTIQLQPAEPGNNLSLYAYTTGSSGYRFVPDLPSCVSCEASFRPDYGQNKGDERSVSLRAVNNPYNLVIGVAGADGLTAGEFRLLVTLK